MAAPPPLPNPLGDSPAPFDWGGGNSKMDVSFDWGVIQVQLVGQKRPLDVRVVGGSGGPDGFKNPLGEKKPALDRSVFDKLPKQFGGALGRGDAVGRKFESLTKSLAKNSSMGGVRVNAGGLGAAVGLAAGVFVGALEKGKQLFIDPLINAAMGGLQTGINRGMGVETFGKVFEVVGVTLAVSFLPHVLRAAASMMEFNESLKRNRDLLDGFADGLVTAGDPFTHPVKKTFDVLDLYMDKAGYGGKNGRSQAGEGVDMIADALGATETKDYFRRKLGYQSTKDGKGPAPVDPKQRWVELLAARLQNQEGGKPYYSGIADVREQAQLAALNQDPLDAQMKRMLLEAIPKIVAASERSAGNTEPK